MSLSELQQQNEALKARLAELQKLSTSVQELAESKSTHDDSAVRSAFETFDEDKSGFIDAHELQLLALELGQALSEEELKEAMTAIDKSGDGKISFEEFKAWFFDTSRTVSDKGGLDLGLLRAKLILHRSSKLIKSLTVVAEESRAAAAASAASADRAGFNVVVQHGPEFEAKRKAKISLETELPAEIALPWDHVAATFTVKPKPGQSAATEAFIRSHLEGMLNRRRQQELKVTQLPGDELAFTIILEKGKAPSTEAQMLQINEFIKQHIHDLAAELSFPDTAASVLELMASDRSKSLVDLFATAFRFHFHSQHATTFSVQLTKLIAAHDRHFHERLQMCLCDIVLNASFNISSDLVASELVNLINNNTRGGFKNKIFMQSWAEAHKDHPDHKTAAAAVEFFTDLSNKFELGTNHYFQIGKVATVKLSLEGWDPVASGLRYVQNVEKLAAERA